MLLWVFLLNKILKTCFPGYWTCSIFFLGCVGGGGGGGIGRGKLLLSQHEKWDWQQILADSAGILTVLNFDLLL